MDYDLRDRLWNWSVWARSGIGGPDSSCCNPMYQQMIPGGDDGYGEVTAETVVVEQSHQARPEYEVDEADAERLDFMIRQLSRGHRAVLNRRYVLREHPPTPEAQAAVLAARAALQNLIDGNRAVVERMARLCA